MTTALQIITDALAEIGIIGAADTPSSEDSAFCLRKLNQVLARWSNLRLFSPAQTTVNVPLTGAMSYTIGPTGDVVTIRPLSIGSISALDAGGVEYPMSLYSALEWDGIAVKDVTGGPPSVAYYEATNTNGTLYVYPQSTGYTLKLRCQSTLGTLALNDTISLPLGYDTALTLTLADDIAPAFNRPSSSDLRRRAAAAIRVVKRTNAQPLLLRIEGSAGGVFEIGRGY